jgi:hypothetical protein
MRSADLRALAALFSEVLASASGSEAGRSSSCGQPQVILSVSGSIPSQFRHVRTPGTITAGRQGHDYRFPAGQAVLFLKDLSHGIQQTMNSRLILSRVLPIKNPPVKGSPAGLG